MNLRKLPNAHYGEDGERRAETTPRLRALEPSTLEASGVVTGDNARPLPSPTPEPLKLLISSPRPLPGFDALH